MKTPALLTLMLLACAGVSAAQVRPRPGQPPPPPAYMQQLRSFDQQDPVTRVVIKNGVTVLVAEAHASPLAEILVWVKTGVRDEPADLAGISKVTEHMLFRGTTNRTASVLGGDLKALGADLHNSTSYDHTSLGMTVPAAQWKRALEIQADAVLNPLFDAEELKRQAGLAGIGAGQEAADPRKLLESRLLASGFAGPRLQRAEKPPDRSLAGITRERILAFYRSGYGAERILVVVCGDVSANDVLTSAVSLFAGARAGAPQEALPASAEASRGTRYEQIAGQGASAWLGLGFSTASASSADLPALNMLCALLGTGEASVLNRRLKHEKRIILDLTAHPVAYSDGGFFNLLMELDARNLDRCEIAAFTEFEILKQVAPDIGELERARAQLKREFWEVTETVAGRAERLARQESLGSWKTINNYLDRLDKVGWADIRRVAARYLQVDNCAVVEILPARSEARSVNADTIRGTIRDLLAAATKQEMDEREKVTVPALDVPEARGSFAPSEVRNAFQVASILRGPELYIREDHTMPVVHLGIFFAGGRLSETGANAGITSLLLRSMLRDSKNKSADQLYRQLEVYGAVLTPVVADDYFGVNLSTLSDHVEETLLLLSEMIKTPKLDPAQIEEQKAIQLSAVRNQSARERARVRLLGSVFRDYAYGLDPDGTEESLAGITPESVQAWHLAAVADRKPMVVIIGDTLGTSLAGFFVRNFSGSRFQDSALPDKFPKAIEKKESLEGNWGENRSMIMIGFQAPPEQDEDSFPLMVFQSHASGLAGRLSDAVCDRIKSAADFTMEYSARTKGGDITISLSAAATDEQAAEKAVAEELARILAATLPYRDYRSAMNAAVAAVQIRQQDRARQMAEVIRSIMAGKGIAGYQEYLSRLQDVKQGDLLEVAGRMLRFDKSVTLRVHGKPAGRP